MTLRDRIVGGVIGGAVGDALGAPMECLHYRQIRRIYRNASRFEDFRPAMLAARLKILPNWPLTLGRVTDDTVLADLLIDCILEHRGHATAHTFAAQWEKFDVPVKGPGRGIRRLDEVHWIERIPFLRNKLHEIPKRELGHGEANATNAIMYIAPVGLLCAGDPLKAGLMAADVTAVNQHGRPRDLAAGYAAALAACFVPGVGVEDIIRIALENVGDRRSLKELNAMVSLARKCRTGTEYVARYHREIIGPLLPLRDLQHEDTDLSVSWNSTEILGPVLGAFLITQGRDAREMMLTCARMGRDADTSCRAAGGLIGAWAGLGAIPAEWRRYVLPRNRWLRLEEKAGMLADLVAANLSRELSVRRAILSS